MSKLEDIDVTKPLYFYGNYTTGVSLPAEETQMLLGYVGKCCWREDFECNLQRLACADDASLLTGSMPVDQFTQFVRNAGHNEPVRKILDKLQSATQGWKDIGIEAVYFDGLELESPALTRTA